MAGYNLKRSVDDLLEAHQLSPPSFTVKLYPDYWTLNNGSKCLYNNHMASLLDDIRARRIPVDFLELFDTAKLPFYEGCMIVELQDYRPPKASDPTLEDPQKSRVVLTPSPETLWADICLLDQKAGNIWTDREALEVEARIVTAISPPLCLTPDPHLTRMVNSVIRSSAPTAPLSLKRKAAVMEQEDEETEKARRAKLAQFMNPKFSRPAVTAPRNYHILEAAQRKRALNAQMMTGAAPQQAASTPGTAAGAAAASAAYAQGTIPTATLMGLQPTFSQVTPIPFAPAPAVPAASSKPAPPPTFSQVQPDANRKPDSRQSPVASRNSATPAPAAPLPIPPHLQARFLAQGGVQSSPRSSQSPHPTGNVAATQSPPRPGTRPPSAAPRPTSQPVQQNQTSQPPSQPQPQAPAVPVQAAPTTGTFQVAVPGSSVTPQVAISGKKKAQQSSSSATNAPTSVPQTQPQSIPYNVYAHHVYQQRLAQQSAQNASPIPRSPMAANRSSTPQHSSPLAATQRLTSRSPMPPSSQQPQGVAAAHAPPQANYNYVATMQNQYNIPAHLRPVAHGHAPHPQMMPHTLAAGGVQPGAATSAQTGQLSSQSEQPQAPQLIPQYPQMYYAQIAGRMPQYWAMPGMGRGAPIANGQHQMPGMAGHPQQMQLGANKVAQGGVQGS
ncbi:uncharacterized protein LAESUDRAFT_747862 [Laetiporus sulphureus 93-53]|uniref:Spt20-like SEP domain-containing protein n=1 Tax=Laetiporus sulphureus 93-53 TaxID=1314785 RepID=A0A165G4L8_9APHY|nr:uncharacterized protein LAESUDRAFT_747862 [Laetiporus sulphureus 93-53]KZT09823.1 hypothetical protein LAESUDRAFT_747862 [Laetiporus sulphureus 93-53]